MSITFNQIPDSIRVPGSYFEFDPSRANTGDLLKTLLVVGQRLPTGTVDALDPVVVTRASQGEEFFGRGSMLAEMINITFMQNPLIKVMAIAVDDLPEAIAASGSIVVNTTATSALLLRVIVGGQRVNVRIGSGDTPALIASSIVTAINTDGSLPVLATVDGNNSAQVNLTARNGGESGNDISIELQLESSGVPNSPTFTINAMVGGAGNPDIVDVLAVMGDDWYNWMVMPWTDATNLAALDDELNDRYGPIRQIGCRAFTARPGTHAEQLSFGAGRNNPHVTTMGIGNVSQPAYLWAAANAAAAANSLSIDPTRQLKTLELVGILPPTTRDRFNFNERNQQLYSGISTYKVGNDDTVTIEAQITNYQLNTQGLPDNSILYINIPEFYDAYRFEQRILFSTYARYKLADDNAKIPAGQQIMQPKIARGLLLDFYRRMIEEYGWCEDFDHYKETLIVQKNGDRLEIVDQPNPINNFRQVFGRSEMVQ